MDWDQEVHRQWKVFHKTLDRFPHSFQLENQDQLTVGKCRMVLHTVQSNFKAGLATPMERVRTLNLLCFLQCQLGERSEALEHVEQALREDGQSKNIVSLANKAVVLWRKDLRPRATKQVEHLKRLLNDNDFEYLVLSAKAELAYSYTCLGSGPFPAKAVALYSEVIKNARESEVYIWKFGMALAERRALYQRSVPLLSNTSEDDRRFAVLRMYLDIIKQCRCDKLRAKVYVEVAHLIDNRWGSESQKQMETKAGLSRVNACDKAIELDPNDPSVLWKSGKIFRHETRLKKSYELLKKSSELRPTTTVFHQLGLTCRKMAKDNKLHRYDGKNAEPGRGQVARGRGQFERGRGQFERGREQFERGRGRVKGSGGMRGGRAGYSSGGLGDGRFGGQNDRDATRGSGNGGRGRKNGRRTRGGDRNERWRGGDLGRGTGEGKWREGRKNNQKETENCPVNQTPQTFQQHPCQSGRRLELGREISHDVTSQRRGRRAGQDKGRGGRHSSHANQRGTQHRGHRYATESLTSCYSSMRNPKSPNFAYVYGDYNTPARFPDNFSQTFYTSNNFDQMSSPEAFNQACNLNSSGQGYIHGIYAQDFLTGTCVQVSTPDVCYRRSTSGIFSQGASPDFCSQLSAPDTCDQTSAPGTCSQWSSRGICSQTSSPGSCDEWLSPAFSSQESTPDICSQQSTLTGNGSQQSAPDSQSGTTARRGQHWDPESAGAEELGACGGSGEITDLEQTAKHMNPMLRQNDDEYPSYDSGFDTGRWEDDFSRLSLSDDISSSLLNCQSPSITSQCNTADLTEVKSIRCPSNDAFISSRTSVNIQNSLLETLSSSASTLSHNPPANSTGAAVSSPGVSMDKHYSPIDLHETPVNLSVAQLYSQDTPVNSRDVHVNPQCAPVDSQATGNCPGRRSTPANLQELETSMSPSTIHQCRGRRGAQHGISRWWSHEGDTPSRRDINLFRGSYKTGRLIRFNETDDYVEEAIAAFEEAVRLSERQNVRAMIDLGLMYRGVGRLPEALNLFECIINIPDATFDKINAYEQAGLILKDMSRQVEPTDKEKSQRLAEEGEGKLRMALQMCSMLCRRCRELKPFIPHVISSFSELLRAARTSNVAPVEKGRMIAKLLQLIDNHQESMNLLGHLFNQNQDEKTNPETLKIKIKNLVGLGQYDEALETIGLIRVLDERSDDELFEDSHYFVRVNMQAGRDELSAVARSRDPTCNSTGTSTSTTSRISDKVGFYFSAAFREATATTMSESEWEASSSEGSETGASGEEDEEDDQERWDVMVLHQESLEDQAQRLAGALTEACGLKVTVNDDDCVPGTPVLEAILWVMARSRQVLVVLSASGDHRSDRSRRKSSSGKDSRRESSSKDNRGESSGSGRVSLKTSGGRDRGRGKSGRRKGKARVSPYFGILLEQAALRCNTVVLVLGKGEGVLPSQVIPKTLAPFRCMLCPPRLLFRGGSSNVCSGGGGNCDGGGGGCNGACGSGNNDCVSGGCCDDRGVDTEGGRMHGDRSDSRPSAGGGKGGDDGSGGDRGGEVSSAEERLDLSDPMVQEAICELFSFLVDVKFEQELD